MAFPEDIKAKEEREKKERRKALIKQLVASKSNTKTPTPPEQSVPPPLPPLEPLAVEPPPPPEQFKPPLPDGSVFDEDDLEEHALTALSNQPAPPLHVESPSSVPTGVQPPSGPGVLPPRPVPPPPPLSALPPPSQMRIQTGLVSAHSEVTPVDPFSAVPSMSISSHSEPMDLNSRSPSPEKEYNQPQPQPNHLQPQEERWYGMAPKSVEDRFKDKNNRDQEYGNHQRHSLNHAEQPSFRGPPSDNGLPPPTKKIGLAPPPPMPRFKPLAPPPMPPRASVRFPPPANSSEYNKTS